MQSIVIQLQADCLNSEIHLTDLLRKALVVSFKLKLDDFKQWCELELNGYTDIKTVPAYRSIEGVIKVHNPYHGWQPVLFQDSKTQNYLSKRKVTQSIPELEDVAKGRTPKSLLHMPFSPEVLNQFFAGEQLDLGLIPCVIINPAEIVGIMDTVRNAILQWTLKLEEKGILGEGLTFSAKDIQHAAATPEIRINNFQGILGNVIHSNVSQDMAISISKGDVGALCLFFASKGINEIDLQDLRVAIQQDPQPTSDKSLGSKVSSWIARMVGKAATGAWDITIGAAGTLLAEAIKRYYGL